jgi:hypothetical protein
MLVMVMIEHDCQKIWLPQKDSIQRFRMIRQLLEGYVTLSMQLVALYRYLRRPDAYEESPSIQWVAYDEHHQQR